MRLGWIILAIAVALGCNESSDGAPDLSDDLSSDVWWTGNDATGGDDAALPDDVAEGKDLLLPDEAGIENTPPTIAAIAPITLDMGTSTTLDLNPFIADDEDDDEMMVLEWSAEHVALQDPGDHVLLVVAPVNWDGAEMITLTVIDSGGLEANADLKVVVNKIEEPDPLPPDKCGEVTFSYAAGAEVQEVLLSGSFNQWGEGEPNYPLADPDGDKTWELVKVLDPGQYEYKFVVDGDWKIDPANPNKVDDGFGGSNSVVEVPACQE
jgi:hypothetical protein